MTRTLLLLAAGAAMVLRPTSDGDISNPSGMPRKSPVALNGYRSTPPHIQSASIIDLNHDEIGTVRKVDIDGNGRPSGLVIQLSPSRRLISVPAYNVSYDEQHNVVTIGISRNQIEQM
jgi:hypothetical protein